MAMNIKNIDLALNAFEPYFSFWTGHTQTLLGHLIKSDSFKFSTNSTKVVLPDEDHLDIEYVKGDKPFTLSLYHGLAGSAHADYIRRSANIAFSLGWNIILVNHRGARGPTQSRKSYHSGRGEDAEAVLLWARDQFPQTTQVALGFSMSGSILLNLLTKRYGKHQPDYAIIVNAPLNLATAAELLTKGFSKIYDYRFFLKIKKILSVQDQQKLPILGKTKKIDEVYTSKKNGFASAEDYYQQCSTYLYLDRVKTPTFMLSAADDPFVDVKDYERSRDNASIHLTLLSAGGHMGYFSKKSDVLDRHRWLDHYLRIVYSQIESLSSL